MKKFLNKIKSNKGNSLAEFAVTAAMMATLATTAAPRFSGVGEVGKQNQTMAMVWFCLPTSPTPEKRGAAVVAKVAIIAAVTANSASEFPLLLLILFKNFFILFTLFKKLFIVTHI